MANEAPEPIPACPAPWSLTGEAWILPLYTPFSTTPIPLPTGSYAPLEQGSKADLSARFHGGVGMVLIVRYATSDAGPYDELMYVPGLFSRPAEAKKAGEKPEYSFVITRIYVSTDASVKNGRRNWGIPKYRADFTFAPSPSGATTLSVSHPSSPRTPFFRIALRRSSLPLSLPLRTSWLSSCLARACLAGYAPQLVQPPLPAAAASDAQGTGQRADALVGSEKTYLVHPSAGGWARAVCAEPFAEEKSEAGTDWSAFGDGVGFPRFRVWGRWANVHVTGLEMGFPLPERAEGWD
ncbi:hypothetical protein JCM10449v2_004015 [Rhodotorula kratochvilovae]